MAPMQTLRTDSSDHPFLAAVQPPAASDDALRLLPRSRAARVAVWIVIGVLTVLVFGAWLRPNMVFDFADMVFCN